MLHKRLRERLTPSVPMASPKCPVAIRAIDAPVRSKAASYPEPFASRMAGRRKHPLGDLFGLANLTGEWRFTRKDGTPY